MRESFWGAFIISTGVMIIALMFFMQKVTNSSEEVYILLKETTEAAMLDSIDYYSYYSKTDSPPTMYNASKDVKTLRINREVFVENFIRRFAQNASLSETYVVEFYDINEYPPKVSIRLKTKHGTVVANQEVNFDVVNQIDAILEMHD